MSGTGHSTKTIYSTGDQTIDGLLSGIAWGDSTIYYSFPTSALEYGYSGEPDTFGTISWMQEIAAHRALNTAGYSGGNTAQDGFSVEGFTNLNIVYTTDEGAHIRLAESSDPLTAWANYPGAWQEAGDVWFGRGYDYRSPEAGNYAWHTMLHELGHALGLKHGQDSYVYGALPYDEDSMEYSVMTYKSYVGANNSVYTNEIWGFAQTYMMADIAALQHMYGADFTTNSGDTVYKWNPGSGDTLVNGQVGIDAGANRIFATIWDGGGIDTYDLSAYTTDLSINLQPGKYSVFDSAQLAYLGNGNYARGNIFNALLYQGDVRSMIENAIGGSGNDTIIGNAVANVLTGNGGNDTIDGGGGTDTLQGGAGDDILVAGARNDWATDYLYGDGGNDRIWGSGGRDYIYGGTGNDIVGAGWGWDVIHGGAGDDRINSGLGDDKIYGEEGWDYIYGGAGNDMIVGGNGNDWTGGSLNGEGGDDRIWGSGGRDWMFGGAGNDLLGGGSGWDVINGGAGNDTMWGGAGNDRFVFDLASLGGHDEIRDFMHGADVLDFTDLSISMSDLTITSSASATTISYMGSYITLVGIASVDASDFLF